MQMILDPLLISSSVADEHHMLDLCSIEGNYFGIHFHLEKKSNCIGIGPGRFAHLSTLYLSGMPLAWVEKIRYLVVYIIDGKGFKVDTKSFKIDTRSFKVDTMSFKVDTRSFKVDTRSFTVDTRSFKVDTRSFKVDTRSSKVDTRSFKVDTMSF